VTDVFGETRLGVETDGVSADHEILNCLVGEYRKQILEIRMKHLSRIDGYRVQRHLPDGAETLTRRRIVPKHLVGFFEV
jgi:hypothetical protein